MKTLEISATALCGHCKSPIPEAREDGFCCAGCRAVNRLLHEAGLQGYYRIKDAATAPLLGYFDARDKLAWMEDLPGLETGRVELAVEGIQCGACVWAIQELAKREGAKAGINSALGRLSLRFEPGSLDLKRLASTLADFGYRVKRPGDETKDPSRGLLLRLGICAAVAMNTMSFSLPFYFGLKPDGGEGLGPALMALNAALSAVSFIVGGGYFFKRAFAALRRGVAHFDIPVALGIASVFAGSCWAYGRGEERALYFDTLNVFITLMLLGRYLQERALLRSRRSLLGSESFEGSTVTLLGDAGPRELAYPGVRSGMVLLVQPGSLCPVKSRLLGPEAELDQAALTGELRPLRVQPGSEIAAGSRLISGEALRVEALTDFDASLLAVLDPGEPGDEDLPLIWRWSVRYYLALVLTASLGGLAFWLWKDPSQAGRVFVSTLMVSCPCGLGIAVPLARLRALRRLRRMGLSLRRPGVLDRLHGVRRVYLDKTGTLSFTLMELEDAAALARLKPEARSALLACSASSRHPLSRALYAEISALGAAWPENARAKEITGQGVELLWNGARWFLGRGMDDSAAGASLSLDGVTIMDFRFRERILEDAAPALAELKAMGLRPALLSGDHESRVTALAKALGLEPGEALARCSPEAKATAAAAEPSLMLGDGLNDALALRFARVSGTPQWERSAVADSSDFSFSSASLGWLPELFKTAKSLRKVLWLNLGFAWAYNALMLSLTLAGLVTPLVCAVVMPLSALAVIALSSRVRGIA